MTGLYQPYYGGGPQFPDGEPITIGPFNAQQAPSLECENCKSPITVGEKYTTLYRYQLGCGVQTGRLVGLTHEESNDLDQQGQMVPIVVHDDCLPEYAHDQVAKDACGSETFACANCGTEFYTEEFCPVCSERLSGAEGE